MLDRVHWGTFFAATITLLLIPGPSVMYVVTRGIEHGYRGVLLSSLGLAFGDLLQVLCTVAGLAALIASSVWLFGVVKYVGAAYLFVLGIHRFRVTRGTLVTHGVITTDPVRQTCRSLVLQGFFALNPKTAIFFLALFPQFVVKNAAPVSLQILVLGCVFIALGFVTNSMYGCLGGKIGSFAEDRPWFHVATRYISSAVLVCMGIAAALA
jgi:threonine/homoserine/homoserine lactone efflux protein